MRYIKTGVVCREIARLLFGNEDKRSTQRLDDALTAIDKSIFLKAAIRSIKPDEGFIIDALRFSDDLTIANSLGCTTIRIVAPPSLRHERLVQRGQVFDPNTDGDHRSETELDQAEVDAEVANEGELSAFYTALDVVLARK
ncbi:hypothetical protein NF700_17505 [Sphingomonadaceae bacterium OTU29MARTA1]|nr:hypothetical protein NF700_17505 [Sphingomonadaceae bacterium OTU29MARTA1]